MNLPKEFTAALLNAADQYTALDDAVAGTLMQRAANINNQGAEGQVRFLLESGWSVEEIVQEMGDIPLERA